MDASEAASSRAVRQAALQSVWRLRNPTESPTSAPNRQQLPVGLNWANFAEPGRVYLSDDSPQATAPAESADPESSGPVSPASPHAPSGPRMAVSCVESRLAASEAVRMKGASGGLLERLVSLALMRSRGLTEHGQTWKLRSQCVRGLL